MNFINDLNDAQIQSVKTTDGPVIIIAGAGSGKTRVLTYRIAYLIANGTEANQILALTFTNKAATEMKNRISKLIGSSANNLWMGTFHSIFARILRKECLHIGYKPSFTIYDTDDSIAVIKKIITNMNLSFQVVNPNATRAKISIAKNQLINPEQYANTYPDTLGNIVSQVFAEYQKTLHNCNAMDFDDLLLKPIELFENNPNILEKYQYRFKYVLVDEFQDTNHVQYKAIRMLCDKHKNIAVVGDDSQSIYSFRGSDIKNILNFQNDYKDCNIFRLEQNYRSTKTIIQLADNLISHNKHRIPKNLWTNNEKGSDVTIIQCADDKDEGEQILKLLQQEIHTRKLELKDFAVLYRTNAQSRSIEDAFRRNGIPYEIIGGIKFYERKEIKDVLAYLRILANPSDEVSMMRIINYPARGIGDTTIEHIINHAKTSSLSIYDTLKNVNNINTLTERAKNSITQFIKLLDKYLSLRTKISLSELSRTLIDELGILNSYKEENTSESLARWENVQELLSAISSFCASKENPTLESFLEEVSLVSDIDTWNDTKNAVTLMTIHASKGLEFPVIFIPGLEEGLLPLYPKDNNANNNEEEERRLFYVGITRAMKKLYLLYTRMRFRFGEETYPIESHFIKQLGNKYIENIKTRTLNNYDNKILPFSDNNKTYNRQINKHQEKLFNDTMPNYEKESQEHLSVKRGMKVMHETFGKGKILELIGSGESQKAIIYFDDYGQKNLILKYANLKPA